MTSCSLLCDKSTDIEAESLKIRIHLLYTVYSYIIFYLQVAILGTIKNVLISRVTVLIEESLSLFKNKPMKKIIKTKWHNASIQKFGLQHFLIRHFMKTTVHDLPNMYICLQERLPLFTSC